MFTKCLDHLEEVVDQEAAALLARNITGLNGLATRKEAALTKVFETINLADGVMPPDFSSRMTFIQNKMETNLEMLGDHVRTWQQVSDIIEQANDYSDIELPFEELAPERELARVA